MVSTQPHTPSVSLSLGATRKSLSLDVLKRIRLSSPHAVLSASSSSFPEVYSPEGMGVEWDGMGRCGVVGKPAKYGGNRPPN